MRSVLVIGLVAVMVCAAALRATAQSNWEIVPGRSVGPITKDTSEKQLIKIFGSRNVQQVKVDVGEGETQPGTVIFPNDPQKKAFILWRDAATRQGPETVRINSKGSLWKTDRGITIGTSLKTIEGLNGGAFALAGFGWDYGGTVLHANGGKITELGSAAGEEITGRSLLLRLEPAKALQRGPDYRKVSSDASFLSSHRSMQKLNPQVYEMIVEFQP